MPGKILIIDPAVTSRMLMKAQLSASFFTVELVSDPLDLPQALVEFAPDVILVSYEQQRSLGFKTVHSLRAQATRSHIPIAFLAPQTTDDIWDKSHDCLVDDVFFYSMERSVLKARLNLMIRAKEHLDAMWARQKTIRDMGFAESCVDFPPARAQKLQIDVQSALQALPNAMQLDLLRLLSADFPQLELVSHKTSQHGDPNLANSEAVVVLDACSVGSEQALKRIAMLRNNRNAAAQRLIFIGDPSAPNGIAQALELGAHDFLEQGFALSELACRIRRLAWDRQITQGAERVVTDNLKSAFKDPLTNLFNRRYAFKYLQRALNPTDSFDASNAPTLTAMMLDLDGFKAINDTYGHPTGDKVLSETAARLSRNLRASDLVARVGGEEFLVILSDTPYATAQAIAERMRIEISQNSFSNVAGQKIDVSISIGVARTDSLINTPDKLISAADKALFQSKHDGRNRVTFAPKAA